VQLPSAELRDGGGEELLAAPFRRIKESQRSANFVEELEPKPENSLENSCVPPVRFVELQSFVCHSSRRLLGYLRRRAWICFHPLRDFSSNRPPNLSSRVHSLMSSVLFGVASLILPAASFKTAYPARVPSLFATSPEPSTNHERTPSLAKFRPQAFSTSRRVAPSPVLRAYCIPLPRVGFGPFRGFSRFAAALTRRQAVPPCRCRYGHSLPRLAATAKSARLRGFAPQIGAFLEVGVNLPLPSLPSSDSSSSRLCASTVGPVTRVIRS
jgi:hypothetical protein